MAGHDEEDLSVIARPGLKATGARGDIARRRRRDARLSLPAGAVLCPGAYATAWIPWVAGAFAGSRAGLKPYTSKVISTLLYSAIAAVLVLGDRGLFA